MKKLSICIITVIILVLFTSCFGDPVQDDLLNYINEEILPVVELEIKVSDAWESVSGENYTNDETMLNALSGSIIGDSSKLVEAAEKISPKTEELRKVHEIYIEAVNEQHNAFIIVKSALEEGDSEKIASANEKLEKAREQTKDYMAKIDSLGEEHNIIFEE